MRIAVHNQKDTTMLVEEEFKGENELQGCLERSPFLLLADEEAPAVTVQRGVSLPSAGILDLLLVDSEGVPIAVEVKLARNTQSRREVVAQVLDYVSDLTQRTFDELDDLVDGALTVAIDGLSKERAPQQIRKRCGSNLRAGKVKMIIAVDRANEDLVRIVRDLNERRDLDIRLVTIRKFKNGSIFVSRMLVAGKTDDKEVAGKVHPYFQSILDAYDSEAPEQLKTRGRARQYRQIRLDQWPGKLHYEFCDYQNETGVELHLESDEVAALSAPLQKFAGTKLSSDTKVEWQKWSRGKGGLIAKVSMQQPPSVAAQAMKTLISKTRDVVNEALDKI